jgi:hypothetical protein
MLPAVAAVVLAALWLSHRRNLHASGSAALSAEGPANSAAPSTASPGATELPGGGQSGAGGAVASLDGSLPGPPPSDSIARNPTNGMIFAGAGKYQLYRQGDLTWRLDTDTGFACILFATDAQWSMPRVFDHGCASAQTVSR